MKILFIGNSYTYFHDMPEIFCAMAREAGADAAVSSITRGGSWLWQYARESDETGMKIRETLKQGWDKVVIQDYSFAPITAPKKFEDGIRYFCDLARAHGAQPVLYQTMVYQIDHRRYREYRLTPMDMQQALHDGYRRAAAENHAPLSPAGDAIWRAIPRFGSALHMPDKIHPAPAGAFLIAAVHCGAILGLDPRRLTYTWTLEPALARELYDLAAETLERKD